MKELTMHVRLSSCWLGKTTQRFPVTIRLLDSIPLDSEGLQDLVEVDLNETKLEEVTSYIASLPEVTNVKSGGSDGRRVKMIVGVSSCPGCRALVSSDAFLLSARTLEGSWSEWKVAQEVEDKLESLVKKLEDEGIESRIISMEDYTDEGALTLEEEKVLKTAMDMGYYEFPKKSGIRELAKSIGTSTAYVSYTLRRAQKKVINSYLK